MFIFPFLKNSLTQNFVKSDNFMKRLLEPKAQFSECSGWADGT